MLLVLTVCIGVAAVVAIAFVLEEATRPTPATWWLPAVTEPRHLVAHIDESPSGVATGRCNCGKRTVGMSRPMVVAYLNSHAKAKTANRDPQGRFVTVS